jgi:hypothetical protein
VIWLSSPRYSIPISSTPGHFRTEADARVHWMQRFIEVLMIGPEIFVIDRALILFVAREAAAIGHRLVLKSHSPPWSQIGQSSGWLMSRNSITPSRAFLTIGVSVRIVWPSAAGSAQLACGLGGPGSDLDQAHAAIAGDR